MKSVFTRKEVCWSGWVLLVVLIAFTGCGNACLFGDCSQSSNQSSNQNAPTAVATATPDNPTANTTVNLDGSQSSGPNGLTLTYQWTFVSYPTGSTASITNANRSSATFIPDQTGTYVIQLAVSDGTSTNTTTVTVNAS